MPTTVVFVHGAFIADSAWWWHKVGNLLKMRGIESIPVDLPSCGDNAAQCTLADDVNAVRAAIDSADGPVILIGHSYGGIVITEAAADNPKVDHLVYMSAVVPDGTSVLEADFTNPADVPKFDIRPDGTAGEGGTKTGVVTALPDKELAEGALKRLTRQAILPFTEVSNGRAWADIPSTFVVCTQDEDIQIDRQRAHAERCTRVVDIPTNHFAHLERPDLVTAVLVNIAEDQLAPTTAAAASATS